MTNNVPYDKLARYFAGECNEREKNEIETWIAADPARSDQIQSLRQMWNKTGQNREAFSADKLVSDIFAKAQLTPARPEPVPQQKIPPVPFLDARKRYSPFTQFLRIAAAIVLLVGLPYFIIDRTSEPESEEQVAVREFSSQKGERANFKLRDGTKVWLNAASTISFPVSFASDRREVVLSGEAYFEVARNEAAPFVVKTSKAEVEVLGTEFNIRAWQEENDVQVVVAGGRVAVRPENDVTAQNVVLVKGQLSRVTSAGVVEAPRAVDVDKYVGWVKGKLVFDKTPLREVAAQLERWYDIQCAIGDEALAGRHLTATFERESVEEVLEVIASAANLRVEQDGTEVKFYEWKGRK